MEACLASSACDEHFSAREKDLWVVLRLFPLVASYIASGMSLPGSSSCL